MSSTELLVLVGLLGLLLQGILAFVICWVFNWKNRLNSWYLVDFQTVVQKLEDIYLSYPAPAFFHFPTKVNNNKIISLSCFTVLLYLVLGFCLMPSQVSLWLWMLIIAIFNWNLASLIRRRLLIQEISPRLKNSLVGVCIVSTAILIVQMIHISQPMASVQSTWTIGIACSIHSIIGLSWFIKAFGKIKAVSIYSLLAWLGLFSGAILV
jgi:hypothetical protein